MIVLAPTITKIPSHHEVSVLVSASHGGAYAGYLAACSAACAVVLNDAGVGRDDAGIGALALCQSVGMAAATVSASSARIGDVDDMLAHGRISFTNAAAADLGVALGDTVPLAAHKLAMAMRSSTRPDPISEARHELGKNRLGIDMVCLDSVSLVLPKDAGSIVVTGSHGGIVGNNPAAAIRVDARAAFYNDASIGKDAAGIGRLSALDPRGIIGATVSADSARIGDAKSSYYDGIISHRNNNARAVGIEPRMSLREACERIGPTTLRPSQ